MANYGTILVVDDNTSIFTTLEICLDGVFDRILTLTKPDNILTTLEQEAVDIILLDMIFSLGVIMDRRDCCGCRQFIAAILIFLLY